MNRESTPSEDVSILRNAKQTVEVNKGERKTKTWQKESDTAETQTAPHAPKGKGKRVERLSTSQFYSELKRPTG